MAPWLFLRSGNLDVVYTTQHVGLLGYVAQQSGQK